MGDTFVCEDKYTIILLQVLTKTGTLESKSEHCTLLFLGIQTATMKPDLILKRKQIILQKWKYTLKSWSEIHGFLGCTYPQMCHPVLPS